MVLIVPDDDDNDEGYPESIASEDSNMSDSEDDLEMYEDESEFDFEGEDEPDFGYPGSIVSEDPDLEEFPDEDSDEVDSDLQSQLEYLQFLRNNEEDIREILDVLRREEFFWDYQSSDENYVNYLSSVMGELRAKLQIKKMAIDMSERQLSIARFEAER